MLHHTGAKSGVERMNPLRALRQDDDTWVIVASKQGADTNPDWSLNLIANPATSIETPHDGDVQVVARELIDAERAHAWQAFTTAYPIFQQYQDATTRAFPVVALCRRGDQESYP